MKHKIHKRNGKYYYSTNVLARIFSTSVDSINARARARGVEPCEIEGYYYYTENDMKLIASTRSRNVAQLNEWASKRKLEDVYNYLVDEEED